MIPFRCNSRNILTLFLLFATTAHAELFVASFNGNRIHRYSETNGAAIGTGVFVATGSGGLNLPHGMTIGPDGDLYVASAGNDAVLRYDGTNGAFLNAFIPSTNGVLDYPVSLQFRPDGFLYVSSQLNNSIVRFYATNGVFAGVFVTNGSGGLNGPSGMAWGPDGHLHVVGRFGNHVNRYDGTNGTFLGRVATGGPLAQPFGIKFGPDGHIYVVSGNNSSVARFHGETGAYLGTFVAGGSGGLNLPIDLAFGPNGDLYVANFNAHVVARFNGGTGAYVSNFVASGAGGLTTPNFLLFRTARTFGTNIPGIGPIGPIEQRHLGMQYTEGPAEDALGNVYFTDIQGTNNHIYKSDSRGLLSIVLTNAACYGLMFDQRGRLIACQTGRQRIIAIDIATKTITPLATSYNGVNFSAPNDLVIDSAGGVYFTDPHGSGPNESVYYVNDAGVVSQVASNMANPNGVILSPDERTLYVLPGGTPPRMMSFPVLSPGVVGPGVTNFIPRGSDGMAVDTQGNLYICQFGSVNQILVRSPSGQTLGSITFPEQPSNCTFGGKDMKTLFVTAGTSLYTCCMEATGHHFAWNPANYSDFQRKFFDATNAPSSSPADDPDGDGASNGLEYLTRTHPLSWGDAWKIGISNVAGVARVHFAQTATRGFEVQHTSRHGLGAAWQALTNLPVSPTNRAALVSDSIDTTTNRFYRVRVFEP